MKDNAWPKITLVGKPYRAKQKTNRPRIGWEHAIRKDLKEIGTF